MPGSPPLGSASGRAVAILAAARAVSAALGAALVSVYFFSPRFVLWRLLGSTETPPEVVRAGDALQQLAHPFMHFQQDVNRVLEWRLLFPLVGHALHLPDSAYLALPAAGALIVLAYSIAVLRRHHGWPGAIAGAIVLATMPWFFVSVGWLGYFDSWCILGLIVTAFTRSTPLLFAAAIATPWVDERFVLTLPLALLLRSGDMGVGLSRRQLAAVGAGILPWILIRAGAYLLGRDPVTAAHIDLLSRSHASIPSGLYVAAIWEGVRWGWPLVFAFAVSRWGRTPGWTALFIAAIAATLAIDLAAAEDLTRSAACVAPAVLFAACHFRPDSPKWSSGGLAAIAALNLISPASHIWGSRRVPIYYFPAELRRNEAPFDDFNAKIYTRSAVALAETGQRDRALAMFELALRLDPKRIEALVNRADLFVAMGNLASAETDASLAVATNPDDPMLWVHRGVIRARSGKASGAEADLQEALRRSAPDWEAREATQQALAQLKASPH